MRRMFRRMVLWALRPFASPVVFRLRFWTRASMDESASAFRIIEIDRSVKDLHAECLAAIASLRDLHAECSAGIDLISKRFQVFQLGLDALRVDNRRDFDQQNASFEALRGHLDEQKRISSSIEHGQGSMSQALLGAAQEVTINLDRISACQLEHINVSNITLSRADISLQRVAVPLGESELLMRTEDGFLLVPTADAALVASMWESGGRLEPGTLIVLKAILRPGDCVIDVGANIGLVSVPASLCVGPTGRVISIEPSSRVADLLRRTMSINGLADRVTFHQCAVGERAGRATLHLGLPVGHSSLLPLTGSKDSEEVDVRSLDDLIPTGCPIRCVKIDVEGFEPQVWSGMQRIIAENSDLLVVVEFGPEHLSRADISVDDWFDQFMAPGFSVYEINEVDGSLRSLRSRRELNKVKSLNLLLFRQPEQDLTMLNFR